MLDAPESFADVLGAYRAAAAVAAQQLSAVDYLAFMTQLRYLALTGMQAYWQAKLDEIEASYDEDMARIAAEGAWDWGEAWTVGMTGLGGFFWTLGSDTWSMAKSTVEMSPLGEAIKFAASPSYYWQEKQQQWDALTAGWDAVVADPSVLGQVPGALWDGMTAPTRECWNAGDYGCAVGHVDFAAMLLVAPTAKGVIPVRAPAPVPAGVGAAAVTTDGEAALAAGVLSTTADEAVFWTGVGRGGDHLAAEWASANGGVTLEATLSARGVQLPAWNASDQAVVAAWRDASRLFAEGASGDVRVLQGDAVRLGSVWAEVEYPALIENASVSSITAINPTTGKSVLLWGVR